MNCNGLVQKLDNIIDWMQKNNIQIAAFQETNLHEKSTLTSPPGYCKIQENRHTERGKGGGVTFIIKDTTLFQELKLKTSDKRIKVQAIELTAVGNNIKLVNTDIPPSSN